MVDISNNDTVHLARAAASSTTTAQTTANPPQSSPFGLGSAMGNSDQLAALTQNPMVQSLLSNPEFMRNIMESDPRIRSLREVRFL